MQNETPNQNTETSTPFPASMLETTSPISEEDYARFVGDLAAPAGPILENMTEFKIKLLHTALGLASEAGEILDEVKKHVYYGAPLNRLAIHKEQGDMEWYSQLLRIVLGADRNNVVRSNVEKLIKRHPNGFSLESALAKADEHPTVKMTTEEVNASLQAAQNIMQTSSAELKSPNPK